ncbi:MAG: hypothetical protein RSA49_04285 [Anaerovoracaceae bacterium]|uniref:hypothetical protein n=1 Tax=Chryseobacterium sp. TaxID=1871047 RepID=UPI002FC7AF5D
MKKIYTVLKLKDEFSPGIKKAASSTEHLALKAKKSEYHNRQLGSTLKNNVAKGAKWAATAIVGTGVAMAATSKKIINATITQTDYVDKMSQKIGISAKAFQEWDYAMGQSGIDIKVMKNGLKTMTNLMKSTAYGSTTGKQAFDELGVSIYDGNDKLKSQEKIMRESIYKLAEMESGSKRAALASQLFGKAGSELAPLLNSGAAGVDELINRSHELGLIMDDSTIKAGVKLGDTFDDVKQALYKAGVVIGTTLMPYFQAGADLILTKLPEIKSGAEFVASGFGKMADGARWIYDNSNILIPVLAGVVSGITAFKVITTVTAIIRTWKAVTAAYAATQGIANLTMLACPLTWIVLGITAAVAAGVALYKNWKTVCAWAKKIKDKFLELISPLKTAAKWLGKIFGFSGKTVDVNVRKSTTTGPAPKPKRHALGTSFFEGGYTGFSEGGRSEAAIFPSGTQIIPHDKIDKRGTGHNININVNINGNVNGTIEEAERIGDVIAGKLILALE